MVGPCWYIRRQAIVVVLPVLALAVFVPVILAACPV